MGVIYLQPFKLRKGFVPYQFQLTFQSSLNQTTGLKIGKIEKTRFTQTEKKTWLQLKFHLNDSNCYRLLFTLSVRGNTNLSSWVSISCNVLEVKTHVIIRFPVTGVITEYSHSLLVFIHYCCRPAHFPKAHCYSDLYRIVKWYCNLPLSILQLP